ncbi:hypothetical protein [Actinomadura rugatobispora]|uniref:DUF1449 family protein n=1 Tax=Actinomadura rugatobispora TaxID=1994 RepID=A0ABW0ZMH6_9ACTN
MVVAGYWVLVLTGGLGLDALDADADTGAGADVGGGGPGGLLAAGGLGGVPVSVALSLLLAIAWFGSLVGSVLVGGVGGGVVRAVLGGAVLLGALAFAWLCTRLLVLPLRRVFRTQAPPSLRDFVGRACVIRTGRVGTGFGQAEVTAEDGSTALVQVRVPSSDLPVAGAAGSARLGRGSTALIFDYDAAEGVFLVMPYEQYGLPGDPAP